jgi:hypothetical protein
MESTTVLVAMDRRRAPLLRAKYVVAAEHRWRALALRRHRCSRLPTSPTKTFAPTSRRSRSSAHLRSKDTTNGLARSRKRHHRCSAAANARPGSSVGWPGSRIRHSVRQDQWSSTLPRGKPSGGGFAGEAACGSSGRRRRAEPRTRPDGPSAAQSSRNRLRQCQRSLRSARSGGPPGRCRAATATAGHRDDAHGADAIGSRVCPLVLLGLNGPLLVSPLRWHTAPRRWT